MLSPLEPRQTYLTGTGPETGTDSSSPNSDSYSGAKIGIAVGGGVVGFLVLVGILSAIVSSGNRRNPQMYAPGPGGAALPLPRPRPLVRTRTLDGISLANIPARAPAQTPHVDGAALAAIGQPLDSFNATDSAPMPGPRSVNDSEVPPLATDSDPPPYSDSRPTETI
ncbi:hypothetical protein HMN09_00662800 [Mycena chlorophos]|uniref:Uncharacterized protein n=1 Tax=Mycena chlorophos TaxID=658473 RepID=A0A8H6SZ89_MYCCL|nr:hypothetical protein HMN09_00662800 [Mycena chlorophos]